jgi:DNA-binding NtrC family response regulator
MDQQTDITVRSRVTAVSGICLRCQGLPEFYIDADTVSVGAAADNDLVIDDPGVSRKHFAILRQADGWLLRDLDSTNGTTVNRTKVREVWLKSGMEICIGRSTLVFEALSDIVAAGPSSSASFGGAVGVSRAMREIFGLLERVSATDATILIEGETGCGKEVFARGIHQASRRARGPFVVFDCGATPKELVESVLFGHEKGAFTGAVTASEGLFQQADGGTLFLDELGELPVELQPKLLRILECREVRRVGGSKSSRVDVRLVAATNRCLEADVASGRFRSDLFFRLAVIRINLPPLRDRIEDIPPLCDLFFLRQEKFGRTGLPVVSAISDDAMAVLKKWTWPGNVRELFNALERALSLCPGDVIEVQDLPPYILDAIFPAGHRAQTDETTPLNRSFLTFSRAKEDCVARFERDYLKSLMEKSEWNLTVASRCADLDRKHLRNLLKKHGLYQLKD